MNLTDKAKKKKSSNPHCYNCGADVGRKEEDRHAILCSYIAVDGKLLKLHTNIFCMECAKKIIKDLNGKKDKLLLEMLLSKEVNGFRKYAWATLWEEEKI